ncbi:Protein CBG24242 [Paramuricea clavata]|uniref:Protein CBG24242 n=1 Tax=Paramuricea clavata TaxID=317549 RepID=A0A7D9L1I7_PARCT|nr:Protein CBG24242 [Paramuricea clavata]
MAACQSSRNEKKTTKNKDNNVSPYFTKILQQACYGAQTKLRFDLFQSKKSDESTKYKGLVCNGHINGVCVGRGYDELKGKKARNDCAEQIINSILIQKVVVDGRVVKELLKLLPKDYQKCAKPLPPAPKPLPSAPKPFPSASRSLPPARRPLPPAPKPLPPAPKPFPSAPKPFPSASRPLPPAQRPLPPAPKPLPPAPKPLPPASRPLPPAPRPAPHLPIGGDTQQSSSGGNVEQTGKSVQKKITKVWQNMLAQAHTQQNITTGAGSQQNDETECTEGQSIQETQQNTTTKGQSIQKTQQNSTTGGSIQQNTTTGGRIQQNAATGGSMQENCPKIPESNRGYQMLCKMGWTGGGLGKKGNEGIEEPIVVNKICGRRGLGMDFVDTSHQHRTLQHKQKKKQKTQRAISRKLINKFVRGDGHKIVVTKPLIEDDHRLLQKLCDRNCLLYEFIGPSKHLVIRKPLNWPSTTAGQRIAKMIKTKMQRQMNKIKITRSSSNMPAKPTHADTSLTNIKKIAMMSNAEHESTNETVSNMNVDTEHVSQNLPIASHTVETSSDNFEKASYPLQSTTAPNSTGHPSTGHSATSTRHGTSTGNGTTHGHCTSSTGQFDTSDGHGTSSTGNGTSSTGHDTSAGPMIQTSIKTELLQLSTLDDFKLGDDVWEIFLAFLKSSDEELDISRNLTSKERLFLYMISDKYGFHFMLFSHGDERSIVIRKC